MTRQQLYEDYEEYVIRCRDGRPAVSFMAWCFNKGIDPRML